MIWAILSTAIFLALSVLILVLLERGAKDGRGFYFLLMVWLFMGIAAGEALEKLGA